MLQIRVTDADGSNPIILETAEDKSYFKSINLGEEGINFTVAKNYPKAEVLNPDTTGYKKFWEVWDTRYNRRLNRGPIDSVGEDGPNWKVTGSGRSALLNNFYKSIKTFYFPVDTILDDLRYENIAIQPRATTLVAVGDTEEPPIFGSFSVDVNEKYQGLSKQTKDNIIDGDNGLLKPGQIQPSNTYYTTASFWMGQSKNDTIIVDLGGEYDLSKVSLLLPWWGGAQKLGNRTYDFSLDYARRTGGANHYRQRVLTDWQNLYNSPNDNRILNSPEAPYNFYIGTTVSGTSLEYGTFYVAQNIPGPITARYLRARVRDVHAWSGTIFDNTAPVDNWAYQCDPDYSGGIMDGKTINERTLEAANDCFASIVEVGAFQQIIPRDEIQPLALQRIDDQNLQINYYHVPESTETVTTPDGFRKFEPGGFFRRAHVSWTGASSSHTKFFDDDCTNCYPDGFNFGVMDQNNSLIYNSDSSSGSAVTIKAPASTSRFLMKGSSTASVVYVDAWPSVTDAFSWGTSYSYSEKADDYVSCHFRGQSFKWYATVPEDKTGATVKIEIRSKASPSYSTSWNVNAWSGWSTLVNSMTLPDNVSAELVYQISYESGILLGDTVYEIKITNLDGNFCSVDSFEGYWSGSMTSYNEDNHRITLSDVSRFNQIYDKRFSGGSMYKIDKQAWGGFTFVGDRVILYSAKGRNHGKMRIGLLKLGLSNSQYDQTNNDKILISGGDSARMLHIDLNTGKRGNEIPQYVAFDSDEHIPGGLPWDRYRLIWYYIRDDVEQFSTTDISQFDSFVERCNDCVPPVGDAIMVNKPVFIDGVAAHEALGLSVQFDNETHLNIVRAITEALQIEGDVGENGLLIKPRIGLDTDIVLREGQNTVVNYNIVNDITKIASMLVSSGSDIDGLPLFTITEDKQTRTDLGRTVMRKEDFRDVADYFQLIGLSRNSLRKRKKPEKRITVTHIGEDFTLEPGDSYVLFTKKMGPIRVRINRSQVIESRSSGTTVEMECVRWPQIT